jgi:peptide chain release factor 2
MVEVLPQVEDDGEVAINDDDIRVDTYRASGAGGQHVNKTSSAVRITHIPSGIVVTCQNERSQLQNRESAMKILQARLLELRERERAEEQAKLKGERVANEFGSQIRSYVLHPYTLVKDTRTDHQTGNIQAVLDGELDPFIDAYLQGQIGANEPDGAVA